MAVESRCSDPDIFRPSIVQMLEPEFYTRSSWFEDLCEGLFKLKSRKTTFKAECYFGLIHFISCFYCLAVIPQIMSQTGYDSQSTFLTTALFSGGGSIICGLFANLPLVCAPVTVVALFLSVYLKNLYKDEESAAPTLAATLSPDLLPRFFQNSNMQTFSSSATSASRIQVGSTSVIISGFILMLFGWRPLGKLFSRLVPKSIQVGTAIGIGLLTALAGAVEVSIVMPGDYGQLVKLGDINDKVMISVAGVIFICILNHYHIKGSFCSGIISCSILFWIVSNEWPTGVVTVPTGLQKFPGFGFQSEIGLLFLVLDLVFLYLMFLSGLIPALARLAALTREDDSVPRGRWIFILCGLMSVCSGFFTGMPIMISPESAAAIKDGAKTGLSAVVCGVLFLLSIFFAPVLTGIPEAATSPVLIMIGTILFQQTSRIDWTVTTEAVPAFVVLFFIPFTYSVIQGVLVGLVVYAVLCLFTGELYHNFLHLALIYRKCCVWKGTEAQPHPVDDGDDDTTEDVAPIFRRRASTIVADVYMSVGLAEEEVIISAPTTVLRSQSRERSNHSNSFDKTRTAQARALRRASVGPGVDVGFTSSCDTHIPLLGDEEEIVGVSRPFASVDAAIVPTKRSSSFDSSTSSSAAQYLRTGRLGGIFATVSNEDDTNANARRNLDSMEEEHN